APPSRLSADQRHVAPGGTGAGGAFQPDHSRFARLRLVRCAAIGRRARALHQARHGRRHDRGDGGARPCALSPCRARPRRPRRLSAPAPTPPAAPTTRPAPPPTHPGPRAPHRPPPRLAPRAWHWMFLALPAPFPETMIGKEALYYFDARAASGTKSKSLSTFDPRALAHYHAFFNDPVRIHATCEDYRAGRTTDLAH